MDPRTENVRKIAAPARPAHPFSDTVYLEPVDYEKPIPNHAVELGKLLYDEAFQKCKEIERIGKLRFKMALERAEDSAQLAKMNLASKNLRFYTPKLQNETLFFIRDAPKGFTDEDLARDTTAEVPVKKVERIKRKNRTGNLISTETIKVTVEGRLVSRSVTIFNASFLAQLYVFPVKKCNLCRKYGHSKANCKGKAKCVNCGKDHEGTEECT